ncbi:MAG: hypothetical protein Q7W44_04670 [Coriobacteriia bacterium]|nr:hypothetical protein [Coriobacteriia bacterium]
MSQRRRTVFIGIGVAAIIVAVSGTAILLAIDPGHVRCALTEQFGWITPLVAASVLGGAMFVLLGQRSSKSDTAASEVAPCLACGRELLGEWRMCPYCGSMTHARSVARSGRRSDG